MNMSINQVGWAWYFLIRSLNLACPKARSGGGDFVGDAGVWDDVVWPLTSFDGIEGPHPRSFAGLSREAGMLVTPALTFAVRRGAGEVPGGLARDAVEDNTGTACDDEITAGTDIDFTGFVIETALLRVAAAPLNFALGKKSLDWPASPDVDDVDLLLAVGVVLPEVLSLKSPAKSPGAGETFGRSVAFPFEDVGGLIGAWKLGATVGSGFGTRAGSGFSLSSGTLGLGFGGT